MTPPAGLPTPPPRPGHRGSECAPAVKARPMPSSPPRRSSRSSRRPPRVVSCRTVEHTRQCHRKTCQSARPPSAHGPTAPSHHALAPAGWVTPPPSHRCERLTHRGGYVTGGGSAVVLTACNVSRGPRRRRRSSIARRHRTRGSTAMSAPRHSSIAVTNSEKVQIFNRSSAENPDMMRRALASQSAKKWIARVASAQRTRAATLGSLGGHFGEFDALPLVPYNPIDADTNAELSVSTIGKRLKISFSFEIATHSTSSINSNFS